jgi:hypothetical protein
MYANAIYRDRNEIDKVGMCASHMPFYITQIRKKLGVENANRNSEPR